MPSLLKNTFKQFLYLLAEPIDYFSRVINNKKDFPSLKLRQYVGPLRNYEAAASEFCVYLKSYCELSNAHKFLDIGCGTAVIYKFLTSYYGVHPAYTGIDIDKQSIDWCKNNIANKDQSANFFYLDIKNTRYNPNGIHTLSEIKIPVDNQSCDVILLKSVFTHLLPNDIDYYLSEISRVLAINGRCLATFFLLNDKRNDKKLMVENGIHFSVVNPTHSYVDADCPERFIAFNEDYINELLRKHSLRLQRPPLYGSWANSSNTVSYQDIMLIERNDRTA